MKTAIPFFAAVILIADALSNKYGEPVFRSVPTTVKTSENDTVLLPCYIENIGVNVVRWWWKDMLVADSSDPGMTLPDRITMLPNYTLQVTDLEAGDTGEYTCQVVRPHPWGPIQQIHAIEVLYPPSVKVSPADGDLQVQQGQEVEMRCETAGVPRPILTWYDKGQEIPLLDNRETLRFAAENRSMSGLYECVANNGVGTPATGAIQLKILYPPEVQAERTWVHASPGVRAELSCRVTSDPEATVDWLRDGVPVSLSSRIITRMHNDRHILLIRNVQSQDLAHYTCRAINMLGHSQQVIQLSGVANPAVFKNDAKLGEDSNYTLIWEVDSYAPIIEYNLLFRKYAMASKPSSWVKLTIPADSNSPGPLHSKSYTLTGLNSATVYEAMILSRNRFGWSQPSGIFRFATDSEGLEEDLAIQILTNVNENKISSAEIASILKERNAAESSQTSSLVVILVACTLSLLK